MFFCRSKLFEKYKICLEDVKGKNHDKLADFLAQHARSNSGGNYRDLHDYIQPLRTGENPIEKDKQKLYPRFTEKEVGRFSCVTILTTIGLQISVLGSISVISLSLPEYVLSIIFVIVEVLLQILNILDKDYDNKFNDKEISYNDYIKKKQCVRAGYMILLYSIMILSICSVISGFVFDLTMTNDVTGYTIAGAVLLMTTGLAASLLLITARGCTLYVAKCVQNLLEEKPADIVKKETDSLGSCNPLRLFIPLVRPIVRYLFRDLIKELDERNLDYMNDDGTSRNSEAQNPVEPPKALTEAVTTTVVQGGSSLNQPV